LTMEKEKHFYSYIIAAACFSIQGIGTGTFFAFGVFFNPLIAEFGWSRSAISGASSVAFLLMGFLGMYVGRLNDRIGPRILMTVTGLFFGFGLYLMSRLSEIWQLYVFYGLIVGIGLSSIDVIALSTIARWFGKNRGVVTGIVKVGAGVGQLAIPLAASLLIVNYGWRAAYVIIAIAVGFSLVLVAQVLRRDPGSAGTISDQELNSSADKPGVVDGGLSFDESIHTRQFRTLCAINFTIVFCFLTIIVHVVPHAQDLGISATKAAIVLSTFGGVSMAVRFLVGIAIDRLGSKWAMGIGSFLLICALLWLQVADQLLMLYFFAVIYGLAHGSFFTALSPIIAEFFGTKSHGVLFGVVAFCGTVGGATGPIFAGYIFDRTGGYDLAFLISILMSALAFLLVLTLKPIDTQKDLQGKVAPS
jgi:MFS family permease